MKTRRDFLKLATWAGSTLPALTHAAPVDTDEKSAERSITSPLPKLHRNLFNGDTCVYFYNPELWQPADYKLETLRNFRTNKLNTRPSVVGGPFSAKAIHTFVSVLAANGIDTFIINANASRAWYPSKTIPGILDGYQRGNRDFFRGHAICQGITDPNAIDDFLDSFMPFMDRYQDLLDAGIDWLAETATACRAQHVAPWVSIRMNDMHGSNNFEGSFFNAPLLRQEAMRLQHYSYGLQNYLYRQGLNYEKPEVRAFMFEQIREVVEDYDFEGLELDWWRQPLCCEPNATPETVAMMSGWLRQVRAMTQRRARKTGRPYPLGMRIPARLEMLKSIGLDVVTLCQEGTLDFICLSGFRSTSWEMPLDIVRQQVGPHVAIYGGIEDTVNTLPTTSQTGELTQRMRFLAASPELMRANAAGKLALGADGIEWFNFFTLDSSRTPNMQADYTALRGLDDLGQVLGKPKHYSFGMGGKPGNLTPFDLPVQLPALLEPNTQRLFRIPMCAEPDVLTNELIVQLVVLVSDEASRLVLSVNGGWPDAACLATRTLLFPCGPLTYLTSEHVGYNFRLPVSRIRAGWNELIVENAGDQTIMLACIELAIMPL